ncbi:NAD(P)-dependent oxidoreductase [Methanobacterium aggregans]|uniref:NAD(P)-dependent oxidoreductase n=1 Tax=Methanobacterium aggregans TaxID=1615586 RepID=UPI001AEA7907|nr:NAD(P)-dependent oxidoreductase [Methanobacterium aggregans]MBP2047037.1 3-hydroxyisobutyrate dehydrogenase-like beta-hydroxyacid dehydrogenase [Methanobacterium aggregans]
MKIGFLGFGEVASSLSRGLVDHGVDVYTCVEGRSSRTRENAEKIGVNLCSTNMEVAEISDITISAVVPSRAVEVAEEVSNHCRGIYVDMNNVSPETVKQALGFIKKGRVVDASLMGSIIKNGLNVPIAASGPCAGEFAELNHYGMNIDVVGTDTGQASALKMLRSIYTKGVSALIFEAFSTAHKMGVDEELMKYLQKTECPGFKDAAVSRIINSTYHAQRKSDEMEEVLQFLREYTEPVMTHATSAFFKMISKKIDLTEKPEDYRDIFQELK